jgi:hypothetical protein
VSDRTPSAQEAGLPITLPLAAGIVSVETLVEAVAISTRVELTAGLRFFLILSLSLKWLFAWRVLHRSAGAALGLMLLEGTTIVSAFGAVELALPVRVALGITALVAIALVAASLSAFPPPTLPRP